MITYIKINGFKSFQNFEMEFTPLTVIAGTNASGKSNLFDGLMLLSRLAEVDIRTAFGEQRGDPTELFTQYDENVYATTMEFAVEMLLNRNIKDNWGGEYDLNNTRLRYELIIERKPNELGLEDLFVKHESLKKIKPEEDEWIKKFKNVKTLVKKLRAGGSGDPFIQTTQVEGGVIAIKMRQDGRSGAKATPADIISQTVLGGVTSIDFPHVFAAKEEMRSWKLLQLNPEFLREPTKQEPGIKDTISSSGKNMAAALFRIRQIDDYSLIEISRRLNSFLPEFTEVDVYDDKPNRQYIIKLKGVDGKEFTSRVLSEGTLRILALCILVYDVKNVGLLCFEEPENGIHPHRLEAMSNLVKALSTDFNPDLPLRQVIINTHSPALVGEMMRWKDDKNVSVHFSQMRTRITEIKKVRYSLNITKVIPVAKENDPFNLTCFSEQDLKLTIATVKAYLSTSILQNASSSL